MNEEFFLGVMKELTSLVMKQELSRELKPFYMTITQEKYMDKYTGGGLAIWGSLFAGK